MQTRRALFKLLALVIWLACSGSGCPTSASDVQLRPPGTDGSARWAWAIAQPAISAAAADAELRQILGSTVALDGRLPANAGDWSFVAYSASRALAVQVTVSYDGGASTSTRAEAAPGPGIVRPLPSGWADSIQVFRATDGKRDPAATLANLVALNVSSFGIVANQAVWALSFDRGRNQVVSVDGTYLGEQ